MMQWLLEGLIGCVVGAFCIGLTLQPSVSLHGARSSSPLPARAGCEGVVDSGYEGANASPDVTGIKDHDDHSCFDTTSVEGSFVVTSGDCEPDCNVSEQCGAQVVLEVSAPCTDDDLSASWEPNPPTSGGGTWFRSGGSSPTGGSGQWTWTIYNDDGNPNTPSENDGGVSCGFSIQMYVRVWRSGDNPDYNRLAGANANGECTACAEPPGFK